MLTALREASGRGYEEGFLKVLRRNRHPETGVRAAVHQVVRWATEHPAEARLLLAGQPAPPAPAFRTEVRAWAAAFSELRDWPPDLLLAQWTGPVLEWLRAWLAGAAASGPEPAADRLAAAAWAALRRA